MTGALIIRGLPECIKNDGWWLTDAGGTLPSAPKAEGKDPRVFHQILIGNLSRFVTKFIADNESR